MGKIVGTIRRLRNAAARSRYTKRNYRPLIVAGTFPPDIANAVRYVS